LSTYVFSIITASRDVTDTVNNTIKFEIPVQVLNIDSVVVGRKRDVAFSLRIGDTKLWTGSQEITIGESAAITPGTPNSAVRKCKVGHFVTYFQGRSALQQRDWIADRHWKFSPLPRDRQRANVMEQL